MAVSRSLNKITVSGRPSAWDVLPFSSNYYQIARAGFAEVELDFSRVEALFESFMLPAICVARKYLRDEKIETSIIKPTDLSLKNLFHNANWEYLLSPGHFPESTFEGTQHVPALQFTDAEAHYKAVDKVLNAALASLPELTRDSLKALKWCLDEITDNVLNHAESQVGGFIQASTFSQSGCVEFVVVDAGLGIPKTLGILDHRRAIEEAIKEGVTRNLETNRGNGLYGAFQVATLSGGNFEIISQHGHLIATGSSVKFLKEKLFFPGTIIVSRINCREPDLLNRALRFNGKPHDPGFDYIEQFYETEGDNELVFSMIKESKSFGSRDAGKSVSVKITNLLKMEQKSKVIIDFLKCRLYQVVLLTKFLESYLPTWVL